jgi:Protein of unknown function (DUF541)
MSSTSRFLSVGVTLGLAVGLILGVGLTQPGRATAATPSASPTTLSGDATIGTPDALPPITASGGTGTASGTAIAYPYFGGTPGLAPDQTIVVTGVGQADLQADGSDRAVAQKSAIADALADAKAQADAIAAATGLSISGVLSVSASVSPGYGIVPMMANGAGTTSCPVPVPQGRPPTGKLFPPQPDCPPSYGQSLNVSLTVEYRVG